MAISDMQSREAVLEAVKECNRLGREAFLAQYGYRSAVRYFLEVDGKQYDSKAIIGVAHGYEFPAQGPLKSTQFSGGATLVKRKLEALGFKVVVKPK